MKLRITIRMDNAAFQDDDDNPSHGMEAARILRELADRIESFDDLDGFERNLFDVNGNLSGSAVAED